VRAPSDRDGCDAAGGCDGAALWRTRGGRAVRPAPLSPGPYGVSYRRRADGRNRLKRDGGSDTGGHSAPKMTGALRVTLVRSVVDMGRRKPAPARGRHEPHNDQHAQKA